MDPELNVSVSSNPISAIANAISDVAKLVTKSLPGDEQKLAAFKLRSPKIYARIMENLYRKLKMFLRWNRRIDIDTRVDFVHGNLADSTRAQLKKMLHQDLQR